MHDLEITWPAGQARFSPTDSPIEIGRSPDAAIILSEPSVSRRHLEFIWTGTAWTASDSSTHGSFDPIGVRLAPTWTVGTNTTIRLGGVEGVELRIELLTTREGGFDPLVGSPAPPVQTEAPPGPPGLDDMAAPAPVEQPGGFGAPPAPAPVGFDAPSAPPANLGQPPSAFDAPAPDLAPPPAQDLPGPPPGFDAPPAPSFDAPDLAPPPAPDLPAPPPGFDAPPAPSFDAPDLSPPPAPDLPAPPPGFDAPPAPNLDAPNVPAPPPAPSFDAPDLAPPPAPDLAAPPSAFDAPSFDAPPAPDLPSPDLPSPDLPGPDLPSPDLSAPNLSTPPSAFDAPAPEAPSFDAPSFDPPSFDAPPTPDLPSPDLSAPNLSTPPSAFDAPAPEAPSFDAPSFDAPPAPDLPSPDLSAPNLSTPPSAFDAPAFDPPPAPDVQAGFDSPPSPPSSGAANFDAAPLPDGSSSLGFDSSGGAPTGAIPDFASTTAISDATIQLSIDGKDYTFLPGTEVTIGRDPSCLVTIDERHSLVSRRHLKILHRDDHWWIEDFSSKGTFIDGRRITGPYKAEGAFMTNLGDDDAGTPLRIITAGEHRAPRKQGIGLLIAIGVLALLAVAALAIALTRGGDDSTETIGAPAPTEGSETTLQTSAEEISMPAADLAAAKQATVLLLSEEGLGSGFFVTDRLIVTNQHVAALAPSLLVAVSREVDEPAVLEFEATTLALHPFLDIAVMELSTDINGDPVDSSGLDAVQVGDSSSLTLGDEVFSTGFPANLSLTSRDDMGELRLPPVGTASGEAASFSIWPGCSNPDFESFIPIGSPTGVTCAPDGDVSRGIVITTFSSGQGASGSPVFAGDEVVAVVFAGTPDEANAGRNITTASFSEWLQGIIGSNP